MNSGVGLVPSPTRRPNNQGATTPPLSWEMAKKKEMACPRSSSGKISLTVRYPLEAAAEAMKKTTHHNAVWVTALSAPIQNRYPENARITAESR